MAEGAPKKIGDFLLNISKRWVAVYKIRLGVVKIYHVDKNKKKPESSREVVQEGEPPQAVLQEVNEQLQVRLPVSVSRLDVSRC